MGRHNLSEPVTRGIFSRGKRVLVVIVRSKWVASPSAMMTSMSCGFADRFCQTGLTHLGGHLGGSLGGSLAISCAVYVTAKGWEIVEILVRVIF